MLSKAALVYDTGQEWQLTTIEVDEPKAREVIVQWKASGLCHSDEHIVTGDMVPPREAWETMVCWYVKREKIARTEGGSQHISMYSYDKV